MFNKRSFALGLGIGIIAGAMLLQLFHLGEDSQNRLDEIGQEVEQGGLPSATAAPTDSANSRNSETPADDAATSSPDNDVAKQTSQTAPSQEPAGTSPAEPDDSQAEQETHPLVVRIEPGTSLTETAELLQSVGAIDDSGAFIDVMKSSGLRVRAGYFLFEKGLADPEQAAAIVTSKPITAEQAKRYKGEAS